jgi:hypothetical protein
MKPKPLELTTDSTLLAADRIATLDACRAQAALGHDEPDRIRAAMQAYLAHHPGMSRADAGPAVTRILFEARAKALSELV